jgi:hypothetical protein
MLLCHIDNMLHVQIKLTSSAHLLVSAAEPKATFVTSHAVQVILPSTRSETM